MQARVGGPVDDAHAALAEFGLNAELGDAIAGREFGGSRDHIACRACQTGLFAARECAIYFRAQFGIGAAGEIQKCLALVRVHLAGLSKDFLGSRPTLRGHRRTPPSNSAFIQPLAIAQSSLTVRGETLRLSAVSSTERPPK